MDDLSMTPCLHRNVVLDTTGDIHFSGGEVWDNIQEKLLCLDCMEYVTEAEVRSTRRGNSPHITQPIQMEITHDHA